MNALARITMSIISSVSLSACSVFGIRSGVPEVPYSVTDRYGEVEIRSYERRVAAEVKGAKDTSEAFNLLFDYISGANQESRSIQMTAPVEVEQRGRSIAMTAPVEVSKSVDDKVSMRFFLPQDFSISSAPVPRDPRLKLTELAPEFFAAIRYSGLSSDKKFQIMSERLETAIRQTRWRVAGASQFFGFDPPWTIPFLRRNEVMIKVEPAAR